MEMIGRRLNSPTSALALAAIAGGILLAVASCAEMSAGPRTTEPASKRDETIAVSLGNLRAGRAPSKAESIASEVLFGSLPEPALNFVKPVDLREAERGLVVADGALSAVLFWNPETSALAYAAQRERPQSISAMTVAANGDLLLADAGAGAVLRISSGGEILRRFQSPGTEPFRPAGVAAVGSQLWVSNAAAHRIDVFEIDSGKFQKSIGRRGRGNGEFGIPLGLAALADGNVGVVDMLNCRVQILSPSGAWVRSIGGPGDVAGRFGRPRTITTGPDGTIFVTDAASQRVHAFSADGRCLGAFGGGELPLVLPAGITTARRAPITDRAAANSDEIQYYILVAEQLLRPGVRVYGWRGEQPAVASPRARPSRPAEVESPHWSAAGCAKCHDAVPNGGVAPIAKGAIDRLCLRCHDGRLAPDEAHPIGRSAIGPQTRVPADWPLVDGRLGCLTCHDIQRHCDAASKRPAANSALLRSFDAAEPLAFCKNCHVAEQWRINPHRETESAGCAFCHTTTPESRSGHRTGDAHLHVDDSRVCLGCHTPHADPAPRGHLGAPMTEALTGNLARARGLIAPDSSAGPLLPLSTNRVTCYTCHNPHAPDLFGPATDLGRRAGGVDSFDLRLPYAALCISCHGK